ncbi:MAG: hypothetical protein ABIQ58_07735 [Candidatus Limnocylindrales bacterium]
MQHGSRSIALGVAVIALVVGCAGGTTPSSSFATTSADITTRTASPSGPAPASPSTDGSSPSTGGGSPSTGGGSPSVASLPSLPAIFSEHADPGLENLLPSVVTGIAMHRYSLTLAQVLDAGGNRAAVDTFLEGIGKTEADGTFAAAFDPTNTLAGGIFAFKVSGADPASLLAGIVAVEQSDLGGNTTTRQATIGGKDVTIVSVGTGVNDTEWIVGRGDVVFVVHAPDEAHAAAYLDALQ